MLNEEQSHLQQQTKIIALRIAEYLHRCLNLDRISEKRLVDLKRYYSEKVCPDIDYNKYAKPFATLYFIENYWKTVCVLSCLTFNPVHKMVDAGCGSGAVLFAYLTFLENYLSRQINSILCPNEITSWKWRIEVTLVDRSNIQLQLLSKILNHVKKYFPHLQIIPEYINQDLIDWQPFPHCTDLITFGHVLTENHQKIEKILGKSYEALTKFGNLYIIERPEDSIWEEIMNTINRNLILSSSGKCKVNCNENFRDKQAKYCVLKSYENPDLWVLLKKYFNAWEKQSLELLDQIFSENAKYYVKPFGPPLDGIYQIKKYWAEKVQRQKNIKIKVHQIAYFNKIIFAEWESKFNYDNSKNHLLGTLILEYDDDIGKIIVLREYYFNQKEKIGEDRHYI